MDVVLLTDVERLGFQGAVVHVKPGFARNYLIPRGLALRATPTQLRQLEEIKRQQHRKLANAKTQAQALKERLEVVSLTLSLTVGTEDKAFGAVTAHDLMEALHQQGIILEKHAIQLKQPIKTLGSVEVPIRLPAEVTARLKLTVVKA